VIRPSALGLCGLAPVLAEQFPETSEAAESGTGTHERIGEALRSLLAGDEPQAADPDARAAVAIVRDMLEEGYRGIAVEAPVALEDPETGEVLTAGTPDLVGEEGDHLWVIDWKTGRQEHLRQSDPDENLQLMAYAVAEALRRRKRTLGWSIVFLGGDGTWEERSSRLFEDAWPLLERVRRAATLPPVARIGGHCQRCWQRKHCHAYLLPAHEGPSALAPFTNGGLSPATAAQALQVYEQFRDATEIALNAARAQLEDYVRAHGPIEVDGRCWGPHEVAGRKTGPSVKELEAQGLGRLVRQGKPSVRWEWRKA
jgi:hypothetical protein